MLHYCNIMGAKTRHVGGLLSPLLFYCNNFLFPRHPPAAAEINATQ